MSKKSVTTNEKCYVYIMSKKIGNN